jgi:hypothetical protein
MTRRGFAQTVGSAALLSAAEAQTAGRKTNFYLFDYFYMRAGSQGTRLNEFLSSIMPITAKNTQAVGVFTSIVAPHQPLTLMVSGFSTLEEVDAAGLRMARDADFQRASEKLESGSEPAYDRSDRVLLRATQFSQDIAPLKEKPKTPRVFELRVYHSPTYRQLGFLHERFSGPEIGIFHRVGIFPILYGDTMIGPNMPNQTYLIPFENLAAREKAWDAFAADAEWQKVRADSVARGGEIVADQNIMLLRPTPYSPIQ